MRVTKAQSLENRQRVVTTASELFRERGFDGVGIADLMSAAGLTHGGFYKHFESKSDLMALASACGISQVAEAADGASAVDFVSHYVSRKHRDAPGQGCTLASLGADAARQDAQVKAVFNQGVEQLATVLANEGRVSELEDGASQRAKMLSVIAHCVGAVILSRACPDDSQIADEILDACRKEILNSLE
ncbi:MULTISPECIES: TetR/AcrR family transcriptional regulator [unclassified Pseudomonas]|uniref:TetR/AcrR family transcriptional regulator n=1 Tax=unclassified Pseudomonas TaxID=196821 RepID=UPI000D957B4D|nr:MULTISPECIES: TetR family transcriptional regulator [unclassified Pseudomonas]PYG78423.1 TetR family transcriptional regulator [Pseudomonas sp. RV120224-01c]PYG82635.1 TetR family transcriptional regulator [Pseudomonas sp. RV120224-01b]